VRSGKSSKNDRNEYKLSLGGHRQKAVGEFISARIGKELSKKNSNFLLQNFVKSGKS
jgi:hypothetical protein